MNNYTLVNSLKTYLTTALPAVVSAAGLPAVREFVYGHLYLSPDSNLPQVGVDLAQLTQEAGDFDVTQERTNQVVVSFGVDANDAPTAAQYIHKLADAIIKTVENDDATRVQLFDLQVKRCDFSPNIRRGNALARYADLFVEAVYGREEGE